MTTRVPAGEVLDARELNRATLQRQLLLRRVARPVPDALEHLLGLQAQVPNVPYLTLWDRLDDFRAEELAALLTSRDAVRAPLMRATVHLVTARDCLLLRPLVDPVLRRGFASTPWAKKLAGHDVQAILDEGRRLLEEHPRTRAELGPLLVERWPQLDAGTLAMAVSYLVPVVQTTPRGVWGRSGQARLATVSSWLGSGLAAAPPSGSLPEQVVVRYLAAFGPASVADMQAWCGLTRLREVTDRLGTHLRRFRSDAGVELLDLPDAPRPDPATPAPVRFLPEFENALLSYADRRRIIADAEHVALRGGPGGYVGTLLVDGFVQATWALRRSAGTATLEIRPSLPLREPERGEVVEEGARLLAFLAAGAEHDIRFS